MYHVDVKNSKISRWVIEATMMMEVTQKEEDILEEWTNKLKTVHTTRTDMNMLVMDYLQKGEPGEKVSGVDFDSF